MYPVNKSDPQTEFCPLHDLMKLLCNYAQSIVINFINRETRLALPRLSQNPADDRIYARKNPINRPQGYPLLQNNAINLPYM